MMINSQILGFTLRYLDSFSDVGIHPQIPGLNFSYWNSTSGIGINSQVFGFILKCWDSPSAIGIHSQISGFVLSYWDSFCITGIHSQTPGFPLLLGFPRAPTPTPTWQHCLTPVVVSAAVIIAISAAETTVHVTPRAIAVPIVVAIPIPCGTGPAVGSGLTPPYVNGSLSPC